MNLNCRISVPAGLLILWLFPLVAFGQNRGFYVGGSGSYARAATAPTQSFTDVSTTDFAGVSIRIESRVTATQNVDHGGWKAYAGYDFHRFFGAELGYLQVVRSEATVTGQTIITSSSPTLVFVPTRPDSTFTGRLRANGFLASGTARYPLGNRLEAFGKLGVFFSKNHFESETKNDFGGSSPSFEPPTTPEEPTVGTELTIQMPGVSGRSGVVGLGLRYRLSDHMLARAEWDRLGQRLHVFSLGLQVKWNRN